MLEKGYESWVLSSVCAPINWTALVLLKILQPVHFFRIYFTSFNKWKTQTFVLTLLAVCKTPPCPISWASLIKSSTNCDFGIKGTVCWILRPTWIIPFGSKKAPNESNFPASKSVIILFCSDLTINSQASFTFSAFGISFTFLNDLEEQTDNTRATVRTSELTFENLVVSNSTKGVEFLWLTRKLLQGITSGSSSIAYIFCSRGHSNTGFLRNEGPVCHWLSTLSSFGEEPLEIKSATLTSPETQ